MCCKRLYQITILHCHRQISNMQWYLISAYWTIKGAFSLSYKSTIDSSNKQACQWYSSYTLAVSSKLEQSEEPVHDLYPLYAHVKMSG